MYSLLLLSLGTFEKWVDHKEVSMATWGCCSSLSPSGECDYIITSSIRCQKNGQPLHWIINWTWKHDMTEIIEQAQAHEWTCMRNIMIWMQTDWHMFCLLHAINLWFAKIGFSHSQFWYFCKCRLLKKKKGWCFIKFCIFNAALHIRNLSLRTQSVLLACVL